MDWQAGTVWWMAAGAVLALELLTGTVYLLMIVCGLAAAALAAQLGATLPLQVAAAAVLACMATLVLRRIKRRRASALPAVANPDVNLDVGESIHIAEWSTDGTARVFYRGSYWTAMPRPGVALRAAGTYRIVELHGNRLVVDGGF